MQLSEFRDLLANDGFAATFQTMGQYRTELLRALDGLRAQADARPVAWVSVNDRLPPFDTGERVLIYTDGVDFAGEQFFDIKADDLYPSFDGEEEAHTEVAEAATHWMPLPFPGYIPHPAEASAPGLSDDAKDLLSAMGFRLVDDFYLRGDVPDDSEESWEVIHRDTVSALSAGAAELDDDAVYGVLRNYDADMTRKTAEAIAHDLRLTRASAATVAEASDKPALIQKRMRPMWRAEGEGWTEWQDCSEETAQNIERTPVLHDWQYEVRRLYLPTQKAAQQQAEPSIPSGWRGRLQEMRDASYTYSQYPELAQAVFDSVIDALEELETSQQAEPGADERAEFETALKQYAEACHRSESCSAMDAARARVCAIFSRAAQSGQRAGVAELSPEQQKQIAWDAHIKATLIPGANLYTSAQMAVEATVAAIAAAPTQQQEGGKLDVSFIGGAQPTHYCKMCHAMWRRWPDGSWNLRSKQCGACCDNVAMSDQIMPMGHDGARATDGSAESIANALRPLSNEWDQEPKA